MSASNGLILFHYPFSPFARRIEWYLQLSRIEYAQCLQPPTLPRPDLAALGVQYRRIPVLAHGKSIYCDTRLILNHLASVFPEHHTALALTTSDQHAASKLLDTWTIDSVFPRAAQAIPPEAPILQDHKFAQDREQFSGRSWDLDTVKRLRPEALVYLRQAFDDLEDGLLADGRVWILDTKNVSIADIRSIWPFHWLINLPGALPDILISARTNPRVFAWVARFSAVVDAAKKSQPKPKTLTGAEAVQCILASNPQLDPHLLDTVDERDPTGLQPGMSVESWPTDSGSRNRDRGKLVRLSKDEVVLKNDKGVLIHHPRSNFRIRKAKEVPHRMKL